MTIDYKSMAAHEAGHAVTAWFSKSVTQVNYAYVSPNGGMVAYQHTGLVPADHWENLIIAVGGIAGQFADGHKTHGQAIAPDLTEAIVRAQKILTLTLGQDLRELIPVDVSNHDTISQMFHEKPTGPLKHLLEAAYVKAKYILKTYNIEFQAVKKGLLLKGNLDQNELNSLLGERPNSKIQKKSWLGRLSTQTKVTSVIMAWRVRDL